MSRIREIIDWKFLLSAAFLVLVVQMGFNSYADAKHNDALIAQLKKDREVAAAERAQASRERKQLVEGQQILRDLLDAAGIEVPDNLSRTVVVGRSTGSSDSSDDGDDGDSDTTVVVPQQSIPNNSGNGDESDDNSTSEPEDDESMRIEVPKVPLPVPGAGEATDTAKRIVEDTTGIKLD